MNYKNIVKTFLCALSAVTMLGACAQKEFEEITTVSLKRCLEPQKLYARVDLATGDQVTFGWDVNKDAQEYELVVYSDEEMTAKAFSWTLSPDKVPYKAQLVADNKYYFTVQAYRVDADGFPVESSLSNVAKYDGEVKTRAVAATLFPEVTARTATSITLAWSNELEDYKKVTHIEARPVRGGKTVKLDLTDAMAAAATATVEGLNPSTEYQVTLCYHTASRGALDVWTMAEKGAMVAVSTSEELLALIGTGGDAYLSLAGSPYTIGGSKPAAGLKLVGEIGADGSKPVVIGNFDITSTIAAKSNFYFEGIKFDDGLVHNHLFNNSGEDVVLGDIKLVNCEITNYKAGLLYNNKAALSIGEFSFDSCDMYDNATTLSGDCIDLRVSTDISLISIVNCTLYDGFRSLVRVDKKDGVNISITNFVFDNNTVKAVAAVEHKDNRGLFALRCPTVMSLKNNLFLYEDTGLKGMDESTNAYKNKCQLFQVNDNTVIPTLDAKDNYSFANGDAFFAKVSASDAGFTVLKEDPCFNSKGNNFFLANAELLDKKIGAYKWQMTYDEKVEDLTQNVVEAPHVWNLQDAKLFSGTAKNSRVRDELLIVATEETPVNLDGAVKFLSATPRTKKGQPIEGYVAFKVNKAGSVDIQVTDPDKAGGTVAIALLDDNGFAVQGGAAASASNPTVQKVVIPEVKGEGTVYIFATAPAAVTKLAWSPDVLAGEKVLATPSINVDVTTLTEGDEVAVTAKWSAVPNAASYVLKFNKKTVDLEEGALSYTVPAETVAALEPGLYSFVIKAKPADGDLYYKESQEGTVSIAVQPKAQQGGGEDPSGPVTLTWDFTKDYDVDINVTDSKIYQYDAGSVKEVAAPEATETLYFAPFGKAMVSKSVECTADATTYRPIQYGGGDAYLFVYTAKSGTIKVTATVGKSVTETGAADLSIVAGPEVVARKSLTTVGEKKALACYDPTKPGADAQVYEWEITNTTGAPQVIGIAKPSGANSPWIYKVEFVYQDETPVTPPPAENKWKWDFTKDYDVDINVTDSKIYQYDAGAVKEVAAPEATETLYFAPFGKAMVSKAVECTADATTYRPIQYGGGDAYLFVYTAKSGTIKVTATVGKSVTETGAADLSIVAGPEVVARKSLTTVGEKKALACYDPTKPGADAQVYEWEITNTTGAPQVIGIAKPSGANSPWIYEVEFVAN